MAKIRLYDGTLVDPFNMTPVNPTTLIHQLCLLNRFHGGTIYPYSVGQHSINLYKLVPPELRAAALIHDMSEAVFNDLASPVKYECPVYTEAEKRAETFMFDFHEISQADRMAIKSYDKRIYVNERDALFLKVDELGMGDDRTRLDDSGHDNLFVERPWRDVKAEFQFRYHGEFPWVMHQFL